MPSEVFPLGLSNRTIIIQNDKHPPLRDYAIALPTFMAMRVIGIPAI